MTSAQHLNRIGPYSGAKALARIDGRSREARFKKELFAELVRHVGGSPSVTQRQLIALAVGLAFQMQLMEVANANGALSQHDHRTFLAWNNTYRRTLLQLGLNGVADRTPTIHELMASHRRDAA